jgi:hypothetical protein
MTKENNGRITFETKTKYSDYELRENKNNANFEHDALKGNLETNPVACMFFGPENVAILQVGMRNMVLNKTCGKISIGDQSIDELLIIMRSIYLNNSKNSVLDLISQVRDLNERVLQFAVPRIIEEAQMHQAYIKRITELPTPLEHGKNDSVKGSKSLEGFLRN